MPEEGEQIKLLLTQFGVKREKKEIKTGEKQWIEITPELSFISH